MLPAPPTSGSFPVCGRAQGVPNPGPIGRRFRVCVLGCLEVYVYTTEMKFLLLKLGCYKFKLLIIITKVTTNNITKIHRKGKRKGSKMVQNKLLTKC